MSAWRPVVSAPTAGRWWCAASRPASWKAGQKAATPTHSSSSAATAAMIPTRTTRELPPWLSLIRAPYLIAAGVAAYGQHRRLHQELR
jgi:hypothetical protein